VAPLESQRTYELTDACGDARIALSVGFDLTEPVRAAILALKEDAWAPALDADGQPRDNGQVAKTTSLLDLSGWPQGSRVFVRRERPHPAPS
jgi:hypothetical protein